MGIFAKNMKNCARLQYFAVSCTLKIIEEKINQSTYETIFEKYVSFLKKEFDFKKEEVKLVKIDFADGTN